MIKIATLFLKFHEKIQIYGNDFSYSLVMNIVLRLQIQLNSPLHNQLLSLAFSLLELLVMLTALKKGNSLNYLMFIA